MQLVTNHFAKKKGGHATNLLSYPIKFNVQKEPAEASRQSEDYLSLFAAAVAAGSVFFPWFHIELITSHSGYTNVQQYGNFNGTYLEGGWAGLTTACCCLIMTFLKLKWSALAGFFNVLIGLGYLLGWVDLSGKFLTADVTKGNAMLVVDPQTGLYLFLISSLAYLTLTIRIHYASRVF
jgi:hypothetical protein